MSVSEFNSNEKWKPLQLPTTSRFTSPEELESLVTPFMLRRVTALTALDGNTTPFQSRSTNRNLDRPQCCCLHYK